LGEDLDPEPVGVEDDEGAIVVIAEADVDDLRALRRREAAEG
jgi:hypothetical protein